MKENPFREDRDEIQELLAIYENLRKGKKQSFIEEEAFFRIIEYYEEKEELVKAREAADTGIGFYPFSSGLLIRKADLLLSAGQYREALSVLRSAELLDSSNLNIYILKTDAYLALDQQPNAVKLLEKALSFFGGQERVDLLFELADVYDDYEEFDKVFDCLKIVLEENPNNEEALHKICFWTDFTGRNEESIRLHQKIIDEFPYNELAWFNLASAYQGLKLYEKSIEMYQYAVAIDEKFDFAYRNMGDAFIRLRKYQDAIEVLGKVLELSRPEEVIYEAIGHSYDKLKNYAQARFYYRKALHLNSGNSKLIYKIAWTYYREKQWSSSVKQLETAIKLNRKNSDYYLLQGECKMQLGYVKDAIQHFSDAVRIRPRRSAGWEALVRALFIADYLDEALEQAEAALKFTGNQPLFIFYKSAVLFSSGKSKEAILQLEKAMNTAPRLLKKFVGLTPAILQNRQVVELLARFKRKKSI